MSTDKGPMNRKARPPEDFLTPVFARRGLVDIPKNRMPDTERRCLEIVADLWHSPTATTSDPAVGTSTVGSSEAAMLGGLALKRRWQRARTPAPGTRPNLVMGINVQVCWEKFCRYWDVEPRFVPMEGDRLHLGVEEAVALCDENTIGVIAILGSTYDGSYEPVEAINFSRPGSQVVGQYYNFVRLGRDGYQRIHQASRDVALFLAHQLEETGAFDVLTRGTDLPVLAFHFDASTAASEFDLSERYRDRGWQVPAYSFPDNRSDLTALRIVCREGFSSALAHDLVDDTKRHLAYFAGTQAKPAGGFHH